MSKDDLKSVMNPVLDGFHEVMDVWMFTGLSLDTVNNVVSVTATNPGKGGKPTNITLQISEQMVEELWESNTGGLIKPN